MEGRSVACVCSRSHGQPSGARNRATMERSSEIESGESDIWNPLPFFVRVRMGGGFPLFCRMTAAAAEAEPVVPCLAERVLRAHVLLVEVVALYDLGEDAFDGEI